MDSHSDAAFLTNGNNLFKESFKVCPETFLADFAVCADKLTHLALGVA